MRNVYTAAVVVVRVGPDEYYDRRPKYRYRTFVAGRETGTIARRLGGWYTKCVRRLRTFTHTRGRRRRARVLHPFPSVVPRIRTVYIQCVHITTSYPIRIDDIYYVRDTTGTTKGFTADVNLCKTRVLKRRGDP